MAQLLRNLGDRSYDRRKVAGLEVERLMRRLQASGDSESISRAIQQIAQDLTCSVNVNHRKGGLIALACTAIGLMDDIKVRAYDERTSSRLSAPIHVGVPCGVRRTTWIY